MQLKFTTERRMLGLRQAAACPTGSSQQLAGHATPTAASRTQPPVRAPPPCGRAPASRRRRVATGMATAPLAAPGENGAAAAAEDAEARAGWAIATQLVHASTRCV